MSFPFCFCRFIVPMKNGDLDSKGLLASLVKSEGTVESFKVRFLYQYILALEEPEVFIFLI